tara:strand:- start:1917 stop:3131 length:1215 start_codon:yes stop_codon:yes gene_type:complete
MIYKNNRFFVENISAINIAKKYGTPSYCYSINKLKNNIKEFQNNFKSIDPIICFSVKSNNNLEILRVIKSYNLGADVVSMGELMIALKARIPAKKIVFSGVGKTKEEIAYAIKKKILLINAESESEIKVIEKIAKKKRKKVNIGIRLNPNVDAKTNNKISTGRKIDKFGVDKKNLIKIINSFKFSKYIKIKCLSVHIGSQITNFRPYTRMVKEIDKILSKINHKFDYIDFGGGMGIQYDNNTKKLDYKKYLGSIKSFLRRNNVKIIFEPGRSIVGNAAILLTKIIYIKETSNKNFVVLDAAMNDLIRPALYGSFHKIIPIIRNKKNIKKTHSFVGPICETTDEFLTTKKYSQTKESDYLAICDVGAYGIVLASNYNLRTKPPEIIIDKSNIKLVSKRQKLINII